MSTDRVTEWIRDRRDTRIGAPGAVTFGNDNHGDALLLVDGSGVSEHGELVREILDAYNEFPRALNALERVLELHKPVPHEWADWRVCAECCSLEGGAPIKYPCSTIEAIEGAIND